MGKFESRLLGFLLHSLPILSLSTIVIIIMVTLTMKYSDLFSCMEYIIIWSRFPRREKWLETPKDAVCYASRGEDGEGDGALVVGANKGFRPHWQAGPACN